MGRRSGPATADVQVEPQAFDERAHGIALRLAGAAQLLDGGGGASTPAGWPDQAPCAQSSGQVLLQARGTSIQLHAEHAQQVLHSSSRASAPASMRCTVMRETPALAVAPPC